MRLVVPDTQHTICYVRGKRKGEHKLYPFTSKTSKSFCYRGKEEKLLLLYIYKCSSILLQNSKFSSLIIFNIPQNSQVFLISGTRKENSSVEEICFHSQVRNGFMLCLSLSETERKETEQRRKFQLISSNLRV